MGHLASAALLSRLRTSAPTSFGSTTRAPPTDAATPFPAPDPEKRPAISALAAAARPPPLRAAAAPLPGGISMPTAPPGAGTSLNGNVAVSRATTCVGCAGERSGAGATGAGEHERDLCQGCAERPSADVVGVKGSLVRPFAEVFGRRLGEGGASHRVVE